MKTFAEVNGTAESGGVLIGDHLIFINGIPVGAGCKLAGDRYFPELGDVYKILKDVHMYPIALTFARPRQKERLWTASLHGGVPAEGFNVESAETICIIASSYGQLGCVFESKRRGREIILTDLFAISGPFQAAMNRFRDIHGKLHLSVEAINGQFVPSYATTDIVKNAMKRSWSNEGKLTVVFCDDKRKEYIHNLA